MNTSQQHLETLSDIKRMMERSSRFLTLSGLSGVSAGLIALAGSFKAALILNDYYDVYNQSGYELDRFIRLKTELMGLAGLIFILALAVGFYFTWRKSLREKAIFWDASSRKLAWNLIVPLAAGGMFIIGMLYHSEWKFVAPACLIFYGLALLNASKFTLDEVRYLGYFEILLGLINVWIPGMGLYFWAAGFGLLHIIYGVIMWKKYDRKVSSIQ